MSSSALVMAQRFIKLPAVITFAATLGATGSVRTYSSTFGSIAPTTIRKRGAKIGYVGNPSISFDFRFDLGYGISDPTLPSLAALGVNYFNRIVFTNAAGSALITLNTADVTLFQSNQFLTDFFFSSWYWGDGNSRYWTAADSAEVKQVYVY